MKMSLQKKISLTVIIIIMVIASMAVWISYDTYARTIDDHYKRLITNVARTAAGMMNPDKINYYATTLEKDDDYQNMLDILFEIKECNEIKYLYIEKVQGDRAVAIMDADESGEAMELGDVFPVSDGADTSSQKDGIPAFISNNPDVGWLCSVFVPIMDSEHSVVALVGADVSMDEIMAERHLFLRNVIIAIFIATLISIVSLYMLLARFVINPVRRLSAAAMSFVFDREKADALEETAISKLEIHSGDEIEALLNSIKIMEKDINQYIQNLTRITAEKERIGAELSVAAQIQADMLPNIFPYRPEQEEFDLYALMKPAKEVGGDFYDYFMVDSDHLAIVIGDVSGKGVPAALFMVISKTVIKNYAQAKLSPDEIFNIANNELCNGNKASLFTTAWLGIWEISTGKLLFADAGHDSPLKRKTDGTIEYMKPAKKNFVLAGMEDMKYILNETTLLPGELILLYTDGIPEATNLQNELYGQKRLEQVFSNNLTAAPKELLHEVHKDVELFVGEAPQFDDLTMLALEIYDITHK